MTPRVLMVDDVAANLVALGAALDGLACELISARSGKEALDRLAEGPYAVMLLDVQMPGMTGYEVARRTRSDEATRDLPIIFLTAMDETKESVVDGYGSGAVDFLFKPLDVGVLRSKVQVFLDLHAGRERLAQEIAAHKATMAELEAFSYTVSHDLRAPLRGIDGFVRIVLDDHSNQLDDEGKKHLARVLSAAQRMNALIDDLLELARVGRSEIVRTKVDLSKMAREAIERLKAAAPTRTVEVVIAPDLHAEADRRLCSVVLENLLANAWKFTAKREVARIEVGVDPVAKSFFVRDNGAGFDMAHVGKLFGTFERLHSPKDFEGTGIGLATVRRIVERHGGTVWARGRPNEGATFGFTFEGGSARAHASTP